MLDKEKKKKKKKKFSKFKIVMIKKPNSKRSRGNWVIMGYLRKSHQKTDKNNLN